MPPDKMDSHRVLMVQWLHALFTAITTRKKLPKEPTLFLIDETATLGKLPMLSTFIAICRGFGVRVDLLAGAGAGAHLLPGTGAYDHRQLRRHSALRYLALQFRARPAPADGNPHPLILNCPNDRQNIILDGAEYLQYRKLNSC